MMRPGVHVSLYFGTDGAIHIGSGLHTVRDVLARIVQAADKDDRNDLAAALRETDAAVIDALCADPSMGRVEE